MSSPFQLNVATAAIADESAVAWTTAMTRRDRDGTIVHLTSQRTGAITSSPARAESCGSPAAESLARGLAVDQPPLDSARQPEPSALVLNESSCYHFRVLDPRLPLCWRPQWERQLS